MKTDEQLANEIINARDGRDHPAGFVRAGRLAELRWVKDFLLYRGDIAQHERIDNRIAELEGCAEKVEP